jgi:23S rRNA (guanosine2251-2'-O)-methyltransferase
VSSFRERNDRKPRSEQGSGGGYGKPPAQHPGKPFKKERGHGHGRGHGGKEDHEGWIWGRHAVEAAIANPDREGPFRLLASPGAAAALEPLIKKARKDLRIEVVEPQEIGRALPQGAAHQGQALRAPPLEGVSVEDLAELGPGVIVMLDQVTDPQNVGAIFRSARAFGAKGMILQDRNAPKLTGALAKAAAGAIETLPCARVVNLSRALEKLSDLGWRAVGLDGAAETTLDQALDGRPTVLVMGSEGEGVRRLVAEHCDVLAKIPMPGGFESLNVSNAAAVALYEATRARD